MVSIMNENFKIIIDYLKSENINYRYDNDYIIISYEHKNTGKKVYEQIVEDEQTFGIYATVKLDLDIELNDRDNKLKLSEYIHRANWGMKRGNFEFNYDQNIIRYKHYFEKEIIPNKYYTLYNILLPIVMLDKYIIVELDTLFTDKTPEEIINKIESINQDDTKDTK